MAGSGDKSDKRARGAARWVESGAELERTMYFSDAVFAIAITLLVLDIRLPEVSDEQFRSELPMLVVGLLPNLLSFVLTFVVIGFYWLTHHRMFRYIARYDGKLLCLNLLFLMTVAFLPFPTSVLSEASTDLTFDDSSTKTSVSLLHDLPGEQFATAFYAGSAAVTGLVLVWMWRYASRERRLLAGGTDPRMVRLFSLWTLIPSLVFVASVFLALLDSDAAKVAWLLIPFTRPLLGRLLFE